MAKNATVARTRAGRGERTSTRSERTIRKLTKLFKSMADEHRLKILFMLARSGEMSVSAIGDELGQSQPAVSHHLTQLRNVGLIDFRRDGRFNFYALSPDGMAELLENVFPSGPARVAVGGVEMSFKSRKV